MFTKSTQAFDNLLYFFQLASSTLVACCILLPWLLGIQKSWAQVQQHHHSSPLNFLESLPFDFFRRPSVHPHILRVTSERSAEAIRRLPSITCQYQGQTFTNTTSRFEVKFQSSFGGIEQEATQSLFPPSTCMSDCPSWSFWLHMHVYLVPTSFLHPDAPSLAMLIAAMSHPTATL